MLGRAPATPPNRLPERLVTSSRGRGSTLLRRPFSELVQHIQSVHDAPVPAGSQHPVRRWRPVSAP
eukprot:5397039-Lingulodinium_polyedra.AAC.1